MEQERQIRILKWRTLEQLEYGGEVDKHPEGTISAHALEEVKCNSAEPEQGSDSHRKSGMKYGGFIYGILAAFCFSSAAFTSKLLAKKQYHTFNIALWKYQGMTLFGPLLLIYYCRWTRVNILGCIWPIRRISAVKIIFFLSLRGTFGVCSMILHTQSLKYLSLADSAVITYSTPIAVVIFARLFLSEQCGIVRILLAILTFLGVCVLARPPLLTGQESFDLNTLVGVSFAFSAMLFISGIFIVIRHIKEVHYSLFILFYGYVGTLECGLLAISFNILDIPHSLVDWIIAAGNAMLSFAGQIFLTFALQAEFAGLVSLVRTGDVVFAFLWQMTIGVYPDIFSLIGAAIVVSTILFSGFTKWLTTLPPSDSIRRRLWFLLK